MTLVKNTIVLHDIVAINSAIRENAIAAIAIERIAQAAAKLIQYIQQFAEKKTAAARILAVSRIRGRADHVAIMANKIPHSICN